MKLCVCGSLTGPTWDHAPDCPNWSGSELSRGRGYMGDCPGLRWCEEIHPYRPLYECGCEGMCHYCSHMGCGRCIDKAWTDRPWWRKLLRRKPEVAGMWHLFG